MVFVKSFCFYFSCRLGSLIVGVLNIIQIFVWLAFLIYMLVHSKDVSNYIEDLLDDEELNLSDISNTLINVKDNPEKFLNGLIAFFIVFGFSCLAMIYGAYKLQSFTVYPFVIIDFFYITTLLVLYVMALLILKENDHGLGPLILFSIIGEFIFLYKYYTWFVVVSYCQILYKLKKQPSKLNKFNKNEKLAMYPKKPPMYAIQPRKY